MNILKNRLLLFLLMSFFSPFLLNTFNAQNRTIDSILIALKSQKQDSNYVKNLIVISKLYPNNKINEAKKFTRQAIKISESINYKNGFFKAKSVLGLKFYYASEYDSAIVNDIDLIKILDTIHFKSIIADAYATIAASYHKKGDFNFALNYFIKALNINEQLKDTIKMIQSSNAIADINLSALKNEKKALKIYFKNLSLAKKISNKDLEARTYNNLGTIYFDINKDTALIYCLKALEITQKLGPSYKYLLSTYLVNIGEIYKSQKKYELAVNYYTKALVIAEEIEDKRIIAYIFNGIGVAYLELNNKSKSELYFKKSFQIAKEIGSKEGIEESSSEFVKLYEQTGDYTQALYYQKLLTAIRDTLYNTESSKQITEMNTKYESEKKDKELIKKDAEISMQQVQTEKQAVIKNGFIIGFVFLLGLIIFVYRGYVQKQKTNLLLNDKNQKITDSINYAKLIQSSILPPLEDVKKYLPQSFIFYQPKDIVSGDFYWLYPITDRTVIFAVVDCTGHGVPGALMSMLGYSLLEQIINQDKTEDPAEILDKLNYLVIESLKQSDSGDTVKNGMDMVIFKMDYQNYELEFAGAKNPLYVIRDKNVIELKGDRKSIGLSANNTTLFTNQKLKLQVGDQLYAFSDGYVDQKGGNDNKKFYSANFQKLLISIQSLGNDEQQEQIANAFKNWKGSKEQIDDVLVFGVKV